MSKDNILARLKGGLIVSCQAEPEKGSQLARPEDISRMAKEVLGAGACAVRICGAANIAETRKLNPGAIIIGITKDNYPDGRVLITPGMSAIEKIVEAGADIVGLDMTKRKRPNGLESAELLQKAKEKFTEILFLADIATVKEVEASIRAGADMIATTLSGYTPDTERRRRRHRWYEYWPDMKLVKNLVEKFPRVPIIAEGRWRDPEQCWWAIHKARAFAVCIGSQATRPREVTRWHAKAIQDGGFR